MGMKFLGKLRKQLDIGSMYKMAELLGMINNSYIYLEKKAKGCDLRTLVEIKDKCELTWEELGKLIEEEVRSKSKEK